MMLLRGSKRHSIALGCHERQGASGRCCRTGCGSELEATACAAGLLVLCSPGSTLPCQAFVSACVWAVPLGTDQCHCRIPQAQHGLIHFATFFACVLPLRLLLDVLAARSGVQQIYPTEICMSQPVVGICRRQDLPQSCSCGLDKLRKQPASRLLHRQLARRRRRRVCLQATNTLFSKLFAG